MAAMMKFRGTLHRAMVRIQVLASWFSRLSSTPSGRQPATKAPGAYALLAGIDHRND